MGASTCMLMYALLLMSLSFHLSLQVFHYTHPLLQHYKSSILTLAYIQVIFDAAPIGRYPSASELGGGATTFPVLHTPLLSSPTQDISI